MSYSTYQRDVYNKEKLIKTINKLSRTYGLNVSVEEGLYGNTLNLIDKMQGLIELLTSPADVIHNSEGKNAGIEDDTND